MTICPRCNRMATGWPLERGDRCSPRSWANCIRNPETIRAKQAEKATAATALSIRAAMEGAEGSTRDILKRTLVELGIMPDEGSRTIH